jgi:lipopolysaccharide export system protein LptA
LVTGDLIVYDINKGTWKANGNNRSNQKRIQLVIPPSNLDNSTTEQRESPE